jgi:hypothetical protein
LRAYAKAFPNIDIERCARVKGRWLSWCRSALKGEITAPPKTKPTFRKARPVAP